MTHRFKLRYHFGPTVHLQSVVLAATEALIGTAYDGDDTNLYRLESDRHIEFLDLEKGSIAANLVQPVRDLLYSLARRCLLTLQVFLKWQLEVGKKYEVVVTTTNGLWRYQLNDIVEVAGFTPEEGIPLIRYIERKGYAEQFLLFGGGVVSLILI